MRRLTALAAVGAAFAVAAPVAGASAATTPAPSATPALAPVLLNFVPPKVGPLSVDIGKTIINGKVMDPGLHVLMPGVSLPPMNWTPGG